MNATVYDVGRAVAVGGAWMRGARHYRRGEVVRVTPRGFVVVKVQGRSTPIRFRPDGREDDQFGNHVLRPMDDLLARAIESGRPVIDAGWTDRGKLCDDKSRRLYPCRVRGDRGGD